MTSKIIFIALVLFFVTTICHALVGGATNSDFSTSATSEVGDQQSQSDSETMQSNSTTSSTTASTDNNVESENSTVSDTNIDSIPQDDGTRAWADLQIAELEAQLEEANKQ